LTNAGCATGDACDLSAKYTLKCFPAPNTAGLGKAFDPTSGPFCQGKLHCSSSYVCARICCADSDCSGGTTCVALDSQTGTLGDCE
jgi:hypothetical protein